VMAKGITSFTKPPIEVISSMNRNLTPEQQMRQDALDRAKAGGRPVGGVPPVKIPPLDADPLPGGGTMSQQASALSDPTNPLSPAYSPELAQMAAKGGPFAVLPPEAAKDPNFRPGVGSMIAANQPQLRAPASDRKPILRQETVADLEKLAEFQKTAENIQNKELKANEEAAAKQAEADVIAGPAPYQSELGSALDDEDWNILNNPTRRKEIEARLTPLGIEDIIMYGEIQQEVEVVPGKTRYKFRSTTGEEDLAVKRMMFGESGGDRYMLDKFSLYNLTLGIVSINNMNIPTHLNDKKRFDESMFLKKYEILMRFPVQLLGDMAVQYMWFDQRVRRLFVKSAEELKNS